MSWNREARKYAFDLHKATELERDIIKLVCGASGADDKSVRKYVVALDMIDENAAPEDGSWLSNRFDRMEGTKTYFERVRKEVRSFTRSDEQALPATILQATIPPAILQAMVQESVHQESAGKYDDPQATYDSARYA